MMKTFGTTITLLIFLTTNTRAHYQSPKLSHPDRVFFFESFQSPSSQSSDPTNPEAFGWTLTTAEEYSQQKPIISSNFSIFQDDNALVLSKAGGVRYGLSKELEKPFSLDADQVTIQFEVKFNNLLTCSGAYIKLVAAEENTESDATKFTEKTPYVVMFGPDKCGGTNKVHLIFRHLNPITGKYEEKHLQYQVDVKNDKKSHLYTLQIKKSEQTVRILVDRTEEVLSVVTEKGAFKPPFFPPEFVPDESDVKPDDFDEREMIEDPDATKPSDWDEDAPEMIPDPYSKQPDDWDEDEDGIFEPSLVPNPEFKGKWTAPMIKNPKYQGKWKPRDIRNPDHFHQDAPLSHLDKVSHVFLEVLVNDENISFDNILISQDYESGKDIADTVFYDKQAKEADMLLEKELAEKRERREKDLSESVNFGTVVEYGFGFVEEFFYRHKYIGVGGVFLLFAVLFYYTCIKKNPYMMTDAELEQANNEARKEAEAKHKKDDDTKEEKSPKGDVAEEETSSKKDGSVRRRTRRAE